MESEDKKKLLKLCILPVFAVIVITNGNRVNDLSNLFRAFEGRIVDKQIVHPRNMPCIFLENDPENYHDIANYKVYDSIQMGDFIIKKRWEVHFKLIHNKDTIIFK